MVHEVRSRPLPPAAVPAAGRARPTVMDRVDCPGRPVALPVVDARGDGPHPGSRRARRHRVARHPGAARRAHRPGGEGGLAQRDPAPVRRADRPDGQAPAVPDLQLHPLPDHRRGADDQPRCLLHAPASGHDPHRGQAARRRAPRRSSSMRRSTRRSSSGTRRPRRSRSSGASSTTSTTAPSSAYDGTLHLYADRFRWAPFAGLIGHLSLVVILAGAIVGSTFGYRDSGFTIAEGATLPVAAEDGLERAVHRLHGHVLRRDGRPRGLRERGRPVQGRLRGRAPHHSRQRPAALRRHELLPGLLRIRRR